MKLESEMMSRLYYLHKLGTETNKLLLMYLLIQFIYENILTRRYVVFLILGCCRQNMSKFNRKNSVVFLYDQYEVLKRKWVQNNL